MRMLILAVSVALAAGPALAQHAPPPAHFAAPHVGAPHMAAPHAAGPRPAGSHFSSPNPASPQPASPQPASRGSGQWSGNHWRGHGWDHDHDHGWRGHFWWGGYPFWAWGWSDPFFWGGSYFWDEPFGWDDGDWVGGYDLAPDWDDYYAAPPAPSASPQAPPGYDCDGWRWDAKQQKYVPAKVSCQ